MTQRCGDRDNVQQCQCILSFHPREHKYGGNSSDHATVVNKSALMDIERTQWVFGILAKVPQNIGQPRNHEAAYRHPENEIRYQRR